jgi:glycosyltransferase involved in cell wall biosynthesis
MLKLTFFLSDLDGGGAERVMLNLANGFAQAGAEVDLVLARQEGLYFSQLSSKVKLVDLGAKSLLKSLFPLVNYLKQRQPNALISALEDTNIIALLAKAIAQTKTPVYVTVHNHLSQEARHGKNLKRKLVPYLLRWIYPLATQVVCVSEGVAEDLVNLGVKRQQVRVIYNPIVTPELEEKLAESLEHPWFLPSEPPVILGVGRLNQQKDFPTLLRAFALLRQQQPARLLILGEGEMRKSMETLIRELHLEDQVELAGFVQNPFAYMKRARVLVLSSAWEGFGNVLVEALAAGIPVVSTDCPSGPREILQGGKYGHLVAIADPVAMARAISQTLEEKIDPARLQNRAADFFLATILEQYRLMLEQKPPVPPT